MNRPPKLPGPPPIPREEPATAPPPDYNGRRYVSAEMQKVAESGKPVSLADLVSAQESEIKAAHDRIAALENRQLELSVSDLTQSKDIATVIREVRALKPSNDAGKAAAELANTKLEGLVKVAIASLVTALVSAAPTVIRLLEGVLHK